MKEKGVPDSGEHIIVDARGESCPAPLVQAEKALEGIAAGSVEVLVDNEGSFKNIARYASTHNLVFQSQEEEGLWKITIYKGGPVHATAPTVPVEEEEDETRDILMVVASDTIGKEEELGAILMKAFFETMDVTGELPHTIFFLNAGVRLTTLNQEIIPTVKSLAEKGVEIYSCGTCLKYYDLEKSLAVGFRGSSNIIVEGMKDFRKTIWIH